MTPEQIEAALTAHRNSMLDTADMVDAEGTRAEMAMAAALAAADAAGWQPIETMPRDGKTPILVAPSPVRNVPMSCGIVPKDYSAKALTSAELRALGVMWWRPQPSFPTPPEAAR